jgi:hypothetical protein
MSPSSQPEVWLRGPVADVSPLLQPVAHALLQAWEDTERELSGLEPAVIWARPGGAASIGFHVRHMTGSLDRLLTYAVGRVLNDAQRAALAAEAQDAGTVTAAQLLSELRAGIDAALSQLRATDAESLAGARTVGRAALPSTLIGLLFHAAEHTTRHAGQVITTARILRGLRGSTI